MNQNKNKKDLSYQIDVQDKETITTVDVNRLAVSVEAIMGSDTPMWVQGLITDSNVPVFKATFGTLYKELSLRVGSKLSSKAVREVVPAMAATHAIRVEADKPFQIIDSSYNKVVTKQVSGFTVPVNYPNADLKCVMQTFVDAAFFTLASKKLETPTEILEEDCKAIGFPAQMLVGGNVPKGNYTRSEFMEDNYHRALTDVNWVEAVNKMNFHEKVTFDFQTGKFKYPPPRLLIAKNAKQLYVSIAAHRKVRGTDKDARSVVTAPYYYGIPSRALYSTGFVVHDIQALGFALGTNVLEIVSTDKVVTTYVLSSLVATGWVVRVVGSNLYPDRRKDNKGNYVEKSGVFSYFSHDDLYLRWAPIQESPPKVAGKSCILPSSKNLVSQMFGQSVSKLAIPFCYAFIQDEMLDMDNNYPGCSLFPTAHAHNGHVIVVRANVKDNERPFDYFKYLSRVIQACTWKTYYVFSKSPYYNVDPYGHKISFILRNKILVPEDDAIVLQFEDTVQKVFEFDRTFNCVPVGKVNYSFFAPKVIEDKRAVQSVIKSLNKEIIDSKKLIEAQPEDGEIYKKLDRLNEEKLLALGDLQKLNRDIKDADKPIVIPVAEIVEIATEELQLETLDEDMFKKPEDDEEI